MRVKAFPKALAVIEAMLALPIGASNAKMIAQHLAELFDELTTRPEENAFLCCWICYFLRANRLDNYFVKSYKLSDPFVRATYTSRFTGFKRTRDYRLFEPVRKSANRTNLLNRLLK